MKEKENLGFYTSTARVTSLRPRHRPRVTIIMITMTLLLVIVQDSVCLSSRTRVQTLKSTMNACHLIKDSSELKIRDRSAMSLGYTSCQHGGDVYQVLYMPATMAFHQAIQCYFPANLDTLIIQACVLVEENVTLYQSFTAYYSVVEEMEWKLDLFTMSLNNDSVILTRKLNSMSGQFSLNVIFDRIGSVHSSISNVQYTIYDKFLKPLYQKRIGLDNEIKSNENFKISKSKIPLKVKRETSSVTASGYLLVANRLYLHQMSFDGSRTNVVIGGLTYAVAVDFHFRNNSLFWIDSGKQAIMKSTLNGLKRSVVLDQGLNEPESLSVDWINNKLYWTDVRERSIGVLDLSNIENYKHDLLSTEDNLTPRDVTVDPTTRTLFWTEWSTRPTRARVNKASMDGFGKVTIHQTNMEQPYGIAIDIDNQVIYWTDLELQRIEMSNVDGSNRRVVVSSGVERPYSLSLHGDTLYISDWNKRVLSTNKTGGQAVHIVNDTFCTYLSTFGIQVVAEENQLLVTNPCAMNNGGCSHLCLLSSTSARGYSCDCPQAMSLGTDQLTCSPDVGNTTSIFTRKGSCVDAGYTACCTTGMCWGSPTNCFCDPECFQYGDCCDDVESTCSPQNEGTNGYLLFANSLYIHRISTDGIRNKTLYLTAHNVIAIDYNIRANQMYWSTTNGNGLWRTELDGSGAVALLTESIQTVDDIAIDWISSKLYWTNSGLSNGIRALDLEHGHTGLIVNTGQDRPRAIVVDPINRWMYWTTSSTIEKASMSGHNRTVLHSTGLQRPYGLTIDYAQSVLYWIDAGLYRIETSRVDGSNRRVVISEDIYSPFGLSMLDGTLYFTDEGVYSVSVNGGEISTVYNSICADTSGIEVVSVDRQPSGTNPCHLNNGGCSHLCLLSSVHSLGYSCSCPEGFTLQQDGQTCSSNGMAPVVDTPVLQHGTCVAAGYISGCCTSGTCLGFPPTCSCDSTCVVFQDCCTDVPPSCQPSIDVLEFFNVTTKLTVVLGVSSQPVVSQFHCSVRASRVTNFEWSFTSSATSHLLSSVLPNSQVISNQAGALDAKYSILSTDYSSVLTIENVEFSDAGNYTCTASIGERISPISSTTIHTVKVYPSLLEILGNSVYNEGHTLQLHCQLKIFPPPIAIVWIMRDDLQSRVLRSTSRVSVSSTHNFIQNGEPYSRSELHISHVTAADSGDYVCVIELNVNNSTMEHMIVQNVTIKPTDECMQSPPVCLNGAECIDYNVGYQCICSSGFTGVNCSQRIDAAVPLSKPMFTPSSSRSLTPNLGDPVNLTCLAQGHPTLTYQWFKDGVLINRETRSYLYISEALPSSRGNYTCRASNSVGEKVSDPVQLIVPGIVQYLVVLGCNETCNISKDQISVSAISHLVQADNSRVIVYSVEDKSQANSSDSYLLVTILKSQILSYREIKRELVSALESIGVVHSLTRYDGCELDDLTELDIGDTAKIPCPCQEYLLNINLPLDSEGHRHCYGSFTNGAHLGEVDYSQCVTATENLTSSLCQAIMGIQGGNFVDESLAVVDVIRDTDLQIRSTVDITLLSMLIKLLTEESTVNPKVRQAYLKIIDYFQKIEPEALAISQNDTGSSIRVLDSLEQFTSRVAIMVPEESFIFSSFAITVADVIVNAFYGRTFSVVNITGQETTNSSNDVTDEWSINTVNRTNDAMNDSSTSLYIPRESIIECAGYTSESAGPIRLALFAFFRNSLFRLPGRNPRIAPIVTAARLNCSINTLLTPVRMYVNHSLLHKPNHSEEADCASWLSGPDQWSTNGCNVSTSTQETAGEGIHCNCYHFTHFGVLFEGVQDNSSESPYFVLHLFTYLVLYMCLMISLVLVVIPYIVIRSIRSSLQGTVTLLLIVCTALTDIFFLIGANVQSVTTFCGIVSAFLQYFLLVQSCVLFMTYIVLHLSLQGFYGLSSKLRKLVLSCTMMSPWLIPFVYVSVTAGIWNKRYHTDQYYFCGVVKEPLWYGLSLPLGIIFALHLILILLCLLKLINCSAVSKAESERCCDPKRFTMFTTLVLMSMTFFICWTFGLLSINQKQSKHSTSFQAWFAIFSIFQKSLLIVYSISSNSDSRKFWIRIFLHRRCTCTKNKDNYSSSPVTETSATISSVTSSYENTTQVHTATNDSAAKVRSSAFPIRLKKSKNDKQKRFIPTDTNQAYQTVMLVNKKRQKFTVTTNEAYATVNHLYVNTLV